MLLSGERLERDDGEDRVVSLGKTLSIRLFLAGDSSFGDEGIDLGEGDKEYEAGDDKVEKEEASSKSGSMLGG